MVFENCVFSRVRSAYDNSLTLKEFCDWNGITVMEEHAAAEVSPCILALGQKLLLEYMRYSDLLAFLSAALTKKEKYLRYVLRPPYTTSQLDCDYVLKQLINNHIIADASYSPNSRAFWIETDLNNHYTIRDILNIGLCAFLTSAADSHSDMKYSVRLDISGNEEYGSAVLLCDGKLKIITIENAIGLEADIASHTRQLERLKKKIFRSRQTFCGIEDIFIVTPYVQHLLPPSSKVIAIDRIKDIRTRLLA